MSQKVFYRLRIAKADDAEQLAIDRIRDRNPVRALLRSINPVTTADRKIRTAAAPGTAPHMLRLCGQQDLGDNKHPYELPLHRDLL
jgi:hypothetical protein